MSEVRQKRPDARVRMGPAGRARLGAEGEFAAVVDAQVPHHTTSERDAEAEGEFIERLRDDGRQRRLIAIAPHGGDIEPFTDQQVERVRSRLGWRAGPRVALRGLGRPEGRPRALALHLDRHRRDKLPPPRHGPACRKHRLMR